MKKSCIPYVVLRKTQENKGSLNADAGQRFNNTSAIEKKRLLVAGGTWCFGK
jgi:hypothetical protein